ncbi:putative ribonuclease H-like domain-containing protein [Tanacetum coccineum]
MNKLVKGNLVRGLPSKIFDNDQTCVACQKGKQHKASSKAKLMSSISQPLQMLHMDLFGPTSVRIINHKTYCLVVTDDFSRTLIEAARTMLADSLLPTVFWVEAVNTACYVLNRVLVTKPHNKTLYELIIGRPPSISFMRPFGCPVTILNTLYPLGKFDRKAKEGFLVGYFVNSKAFRVFNSQTKKVEENLHVNFLENKPNVARQGPNGLFDIDSLTNSMNYQPVTIGNQTNKNAGSQEANGNTGLKQSIDAGQSEEKNVLTQQYIVFPLWSSISSSYKSSNENDTADDSAGESHVQKPASENKQALKNILDKMMDQEKEATNTPVNAASALRTSNDAGPSYVPLGRSFPLNVNDLPDDPFMLDLEDTAEKRTNHKDFQNCLFACFLSALNDKSWVEAMQEELLQFKIQKVWTLVNLPYGKKAIGTKWVYRNKKDERGIVVRNKAGQDLSNQRRAWYETLSTYLLDNGFYRGQIDKTLFIKRVKGDILLDKYVGEILKKFGFSIVRTANTPMETNKVLTKDEDGKDVDIHLYTIGSLMYLTSFRPNIMFSFCACLRFQVQPKVSHLNAVKRIFRYLKGRPNLGLWYPKDSPFILKAFSDSDYEGASLDRKSITGGCQFLGSRLISWQCKK